MLSLLQILNYKVHILNIHLSGVVFITLLKLLDVFVR